MFRRRSSSKRPSLKILIALIVPLVAIGAFLYYQEDFRQELFSRLIPRTEEKSIGSFNLDIQEYISRFFGERSRNDTAQDIIKAERVGRVAIVSDSHGDLETFEILLRKVKADDAELIIHLGDIVEAGGLEDLRAIKLLLDDTGIPYEVLPGDHDYNWKPAHDLQNYSTIFGPASGQNRTIEFRGYVFILFNNSEQDDSTAANVLWLQNTLVEIQAKTNRGVFFFSSRPLTNPYFGQKNDAAGEQILSMLKEFGVKEVFSGDTHIFSRYIDEVNGVSNTTVGASGSYKNPLPQYVIFDVLADGNYDVVAKPGTDVQSLD